VFADFDERAAVRGDVDVGGVSVGRFFVVGVGLGTGGRKEGDADEGEEQAGGGFHDGK
jgi:hypothetical protein